MKLVTIFIIIVVVVFLVTIVIQAHPPCYYDQIQGEWEFQESLQQDRKDQKCNETMSEIVEKFRVKLNFPNVALDLDQGHVGTWTMINVAGFEVILNYRKYFGFFNMDHIGGKRACTHTNLGWSHDVLERNWACFHGVKIDNATKPSNDEKAGIQNQTQKPNLFEQIDFSEYLSEAYVENVLNSKQNSWRARVYPEFQAMSREQLIQMAGGRGSQMSSRPTLGVSTEEIRLMSSKLPESFDWRNVSGVNYVSPVRKQSCGDCYAQASVGMLESRVRVTTGNAKKPLLSVQDILDCSGSYTFGCNGGFTYLTGGKYAQDFGFTTEQCYPYRNKSESGSCSPNTSSIECRRRTYTLKYEYIGGYYGACNEDLMMLELVQNGPFATSMKVDDKCFLILNYASGVFEHTPVEVESRFDPYEYLNHAVLIVGYGYDRRSNLKYWIVKNSWGVDWGTYGYFLIRRGTDECGIENIAFAATVIP